MQLFWKVDWNRRKENQKKRKPEKMKILLQTVTVLMILCSLSVVSRAEDKTEDKTVYTCPLGGKKISPAKDSVGHFDYHGIRLYTCCEKVVGNGVC